MNANGHRDMAKRIVLALSVALVAVLATCLPAGAACTISTTSVSFGTYSVFSLTPLDSTGTVTFQCGKEKNIQISLSRGGAPAFNPRQMLSGAERLNYNLHLDAARTSIWGDGTGGTTTYFNNNPPNNTDVIVTIYGRIPAGQDVRAGIYTDTVTATINY